MKHHIPIQIIRDKITLLVLECKREQQLREFFFTALYYKASGTPLAFTQVAMLE